MEEAPNAQQKMNFEAVPVVFKSRDESGNEAHTIGLIIRPSGQASTASPNSATKVATTAIPIAPVSSQAGQLPTQIQIVQNANAAPKPISLRPCGTARADPAALLAAARSVNPASILRPIGTTTTASGTQILTSLPAGKVNLMSPKSGKNSKKVKTTASAQNLVPVNSSQKFTSTATLPGQNLRFPALATGQKITSTATSAQDFASPTSSSQSLRSPATSNQNLQSPASSNLLSPAPSNQNLISSPLSNLPVLSPAPSNLPVLSPVPSNQHLLSPASTSKKTKKDKSPTIHNFCKDLPPTDFSKVDRPEKAVNGGVDKTFKEPEKAESTFNKQSHLNAYKPPAIQREEYQQRPSTSTAPQMNESAALEDLNSIEMNQLLANTSTINTEDYLDQTLSSNMDFFVDRPSTSANNDYNYPQQPKQVASTSDHRFPAPPVQHHPKYYYHPNQQHHANGHHMPPLMPHHGHQMSHGGPLLQPAHINDHPPNHHQHFGHRGVYSFSHQQQMVDPRRAAIMHGMHPPGSNQLSTSPDSGIQSIDGSPPSMSTPPMVSPYTVQAANYDVHNDANGYQSQPSYCPPSCSNSTNPVVSVQSNQHEEEDDDDFSDMPTLIRADQSEHPEPEHKAPASVPETSTSKLDTSTGSANTSLPSRSFSRASTSQLEEEKEAEKTIAITPGMDLAEIAERLMSTFDPEKLKQFTSLIQSKTSEAKSPVVPGPPPKLNSSITTPTVPSTIPPFKAPSRNKRELAQTQQLTSNDENIDKKPKRRGRPPKASSSKQHESDGDEEPEKEKEPRQETAEEIALKNEQRRIYRQKVEKKLRQKLAAVIDRTEQAFQKIRLDLGPCHSFPLPWQSPNWALVEERCKRWERKRKSDENIEFAEEKKPKLEPEVVVKKGRGRPRHKPPVLEVQQVPVVKKTPGRPGRKPKNWQPPAEEAPKSQISPENLLRVQTPDKSKSPVSPKRKRSKNDFVKIRSNVLIDAPPRLPDAEPCSCSFSNACITRNCSHRAVFEECTQATCEWHDQCHNRRMGNNEAIHQLQIFDTERCGRGVRSATDIYPGQFICEYVGEVVKHQSYQLRTLMRSEDMPRFGIHLTNTYIVDATQKGSIARFINHSCDPNCEMQRWTVNGYYRLGIFAKKKIEEGDELTYDYGMFAQMEPRQKCECGSPKCKDYISYQPTEKPVVCDEPQQFNKKQVELVHTTHVLLPRNLRKFSRKSPNRSVPLCKRYPELSSFLLGIYENAIQHAENRERIARKRITQLCNSMRRLMTMSHKSSDELTERFDGLFKSWMNSLLPTYERRVVDALRSHYLHLKKTRDIEHHCPRLTKEAARQFTEERKKIQLAMKREYNRVLSAEADLSYINSGSQIGSYNPDENVQFSEKSNDMDCVRCLCGIMEDDGNMVSCDKCNFWMHADCVRFDSKDDEFECDFCRKSLEYTPAVDIVLKPQPEFNFPGCTYYRTLVNARGIQVRINEAVYVERLINDDYKAILKSMHEECAQMPKKRGRKLKDPQKAKEKEQSMGAALTKKLFNRQDVRHFRVERLFVSPQGQRFVFGCYYARPHETFCDSTRLFHKNELFWTPMFDTLPLDAVIGRCLILEPVNWIDGRPRIPKYKEEDVYVCEYQIDKNQRTFTKIQPNNHYYLNTSPYVFGKFAQKKELKRDFTPFVMGMSSNSAKVERSENKEKVMNVAKELSSRRLKLVWKRIIHHNQLGLQNFRTQPN